jgi:hypothetical protein
METLINGPLQPPGMGEIVDLDETKRELRGPCFRDAAALPSLFRLNCTKSVRQNPQIVDHTVY